MAHKVMNGLDLTNQRIQNLGSPSIGTDAVNKTYVDNVAAGLFWKSPVRAASTGNITISAPGTTIDGVTMATNDRFLAKDQTTSAEKGIYVFNGSATPATRATDADTTGELAPGTAVTVTEGTVSADKSYIITSDAAITIGTTGMTWGLFSAGTSYTAGNGLQLIGAAFSVLLDTASGLSVSGTGLKIDTAVVVRKYAANIGNGSLTSIVVNHALGTQDVTVTLYEIATLAEVFADVVHTDANNVTVTFATAPASNSFRCIVQG